jgi:glutathione S-transferase
MKWIAWANVSLGDAVGRWLRNTADWTPVEQHNAKAAEAALVDLKNCLSILDQALVDKPWLVDGYSLADSHVHSFTDWLRHMKIDLSAYSHLAAWSQRCTARPAYARAMTGA